MGQVHDFIRRRPALHAICGNVSLPEPIRVSDNMAITPVRPMGAELEASYVRDFARLIGYETDVGLHGMIAERGKEFRPVVLCTVVVASGDTADAIEKAGAEQLLLLRLVLSWVAQSRAQVLAVIAAARDTFHWKLGDAHSPRMAYRMPFGDSGEPLRTIMKAADLDRRFRFLLTQFVEALGEADPEFLMSRCFVCMEGLAHEHKTERIGSREAVRLLCRSLDVPYEVHIQTEKGSTVIDTVEISGRVRRELMHGYPFGKDLPAWLKELLGREEVQALVVPSVIGCCESLVEACARRILGEQAGGA